MITISRQLRLCFTVAGLVAAFETHAYAEDVPAGAMAADVSGGGTDESYQAVSSTPTNPVSLLAYHISHVNETPQVEMAGVHYRPRRGFSDRVDASSVSQFHVGFFDPDGERGSQFLLGVRGGPMLDSHIQIGLGVDWIHKTEKTSTVTSTQNGPGGTPIEVRQELARASSHLFPLMA